ncbi:GNAT family N-acetyltransferase [Bailinhaonella thermotolerans]|uniref:GNAT family N-acetyltransferase n=2 Tax=Bailinhaonella thermotolerans TaxID=1070861 RepID=A0A3A4AC11_9ACTN|nr:GNAT family N-acetyltransferase [Bailinhaonella thermotolerans]
MDQTRWLVPDASARRAVLAGDFQILVEHAMEHGTVYRAGEQAVAVWVDRTKDVPEPADYERRLAEACGEYAERFVTLDELFEAHHPADPHQHLAMLAVRPEAQGMGLGAVLLRHHHAILDEAGVDAYLEASDPANRKLYLRHGYADLGEPFALPGAEPFFPMWRPAGATAAG